MEDRNTLVLTRVRKEKARRLESRAEEVLLAAQGLPNDQIGASLSIPRQIVSKWRKRFFEERLAGLADEPRPGRPPVFPPRSRRPG